MHPPHCFTVRGMKLHVRSPLENRTRQKRNVNKTLKLGQTRRRTNSPSPCFSNPISAVACNRRKRVHTMLLFLCYTKDGHLRGQERSHPEGLGCLPRAPPPCPGLESLARACTSPKLGDHRSRAGTASAPIVSEMQGRPHPAEAARLLSVGGRRGLLKLLPLCCLCPETVRHAQRARTRPP